MGTTILFKFRIVITAIRINPQQFYKFGTKYCFNVSCRIVKASASVLDSEQS